MKNGEETASQLRDQIKSIEKQIENHLRALKEEVAGVVPSVQDTIAKHPMLCVGGALAAGTLLGILLSRQSCTPSVALAPDVPHDVHSAAGDDDDASVCTNRSNASSRPVIVQGSSLGSTLGVEFARVLMPVVAGWAANKLSSSSFQPPTESEKQT